MNSNRVVLSVKNLKKKIGKKWIIKGVSFEIHEGEVLGFLGPNGSGKTTTIRMLVDLIRPSEGRVLLCGKDVQKEHDEALRCVGSIVENPEMYPFMTGRENLEHFARMLPGISPSRIDQVTETVGLTQRINDKVKTYSLGMKQRLGIAQALLGDPKLLILDEPTNGLDPQGIKELRDFVRRLADQGMGIFISSHLLSEIQLMCDRVAIISKGSVLAVGGVDELLRQAQAKVIWHVDDAAAAERIFASLNEPAVKILPLSAAVSEVAVSAEARWIVTEIEIESVPQINQRLVEQGVKVFALQVKQPSLEELFLSLTEGEAID